MAKNRYRILVLVMIILLLMGVDPLVEAVFQFKYNKLLQTNETLFPMHQLYGEERIQADKNFLYGIAGFISLLLFLLLWSQEKLAIVKHVRSPQPKPILFQIFSIRLLGLFLIFGAFMLSLVVFEEVLTTYITASNILATAIMLVILNTLIFLPYVACKGIYDGFKLNIFIKFSLGASAMLVVCMAIGVSQYAAGGIAVLLSSFGFFKAMRLEFNGLEDFFELRGKTFAEQLGGAPPVYYPELPIDRNLVSDRFVPENSTATDPVVFYAPKEKSTLILVALGAGGTFISFIGLQLLDFARFEVVPLFFLSFGAVMLFFAVRIFINRQKAILLAIDQDGFRCIDTDFSYSETSGNALDVIYRLYIFPRYKRFLFTDVKRFEIVYDTAIGPILLFYPIHRSKRMMVFYFDQHYTVEVIYNLLEEKRNARIAQRRFNS